MLALDSREILYQSAACLIYLCIFPHPLSALCSGLIISSFLSFVWLLFNSLSVSRGPLTLLLGNSSLQDWSEPNREQRHYCQLLSVVLQADRHLQICGHILWHTNTHTHTVLTVIHSHGITEIWEKKWEKQLYLFSADPATAKGGLLTSQWNIFPTSSVDRWGSLFVIS